MSKVEFICIHCPVGCKIIVENEEIMGNECKRGEEYVIQEMKNAKRILTTTVFIEGEQRMLPVKSDGEIPKELIKDCMRELAKVKARLPIKRGDVIYKTSTGINIIATRSMEKKQE